MIRDYLTVESGKGGLFWAFPDNTHWSFTVSRIIGLIDFGGANFAEIIQAVTRIKDGDEESWYNSWARLASQLEVLAHEASASGNMHSTVSFLHRAANYHRMAQFFFTGQDPRKIESLTKAGTLFERTLHRLPVHAEMIHVPYKGALLPGYHFLPRGADRKRPAIIYLNGADSLPSEVYFTVGLTMALSGYHFMVYEAPGVGLSLYRRNIPTTYASEEFVSPALDLLSQRSDVDKDRIILMGESFAGYLVPRAAAFEPRIAAIVISSPIYRYEAYRRYLGSGPAFREHLLRLFGCSTAEELRQEADHYTLAGVLDRVKCPALLIQGAEDPLIVNPVNEGLRVLNELGTSDKKLVVYETGGGLGGFTHCQKDNLHLFHADSVSWMREHGLGGEEVDQ
ncbi:MAG: alpha/beta hydrolase [Firmicutes bacterium]|nr:alpha/beta hydrolase [Bacillota bacterium]